MIEITGKYNTAHCYVDELDQATISQVYSFLNNPVFEKGRIALMPDCHKGKGSCIGFTMPLGDKVIPNVIGVDIGCGMLSVNLGSQDNIDFEALDKHIRNVVPLGHNIRNNKYPKNDQQRLYTKYVGKDFSSWKKRKDDIIRLTGMDSKRAHNSLGTLGGGNHFIELNKNTEDNSVILTIHSGSRNFGLQVAKFYQNKADESCNYTDNPNKIEELKKLYSGKELGNKIKELKSSISKVSKDQAYLTGLFKDMYLKDLSIAQKYSQLNRYIMASEIVKFFNLNIFDLECIESIHNWIADDNIIRKGAIQANKGQKVIIPLNMRDGIIIGIGKGNEEYNKSAPHGAGRILSRSKAKEELDIEEFKEEMKNVFSTSVSESTLDESPMAYKNMDMIIEYLKPTVDIIGRYLPIYNLKG